jgi:hypothetical protein
MSARLALALARPPLGRMSRGGVVRALHPRVSPAALRVPHPLHIAFPITFPVGQPQIFVHEGARQSLERRLAQACHRPVALAVTDNCRNMISFTKCDGMLRARLHHMFLDAPHNVQDALVRYLAQSDRAASLVVGRFIEESSFRIRATRPVKRRLTTQGVHHDLSTLFQKVNDKYFGGSVDALITWGRTGPSRSRANPRRAIKLGSYSASERLIRIHRGLDRPWVPRYFISYVIYHEMLHHVIPASQGGGRRMLHPPEFMHREHQFREIDRALSWEKAHVARLLRT